MTKLPLPILFLAGACAPLGSDWDQDPCATRSEFIGSLHLPDSWVHQTYPGPWRDQMELGQRAADQRRLAQAETYFLAAAETAKSCHFSELFRALALTGLGNAYAQSGFS